MPVAVDVLCRRCEVEIPLMLRCGYAVHAQTLALHLAGQRLLRHRHHAPRQNLDDRPYAVRGAYLFTAAPQLKAARVQPQPPFAGRGDDLYPLPGGGSAAHIQPLPQQHPCVPLDKQRVHAAAAAVRVVPGSVLKAAEKLSGGCGL